MKKTQLTLSALLILSLIIPLCILCTAAADSPSTVTLRIESYDCNIFYEKVSIDTNASTNLGALLTDIDTKNDDLTILGIENGYITDINDVTGARFGGWDGWLYMVNGEGPSCTINDYILKADDSIIIYYGDPYGMAGMQYPEVDDSKFESDGILKFVSSDTTYDANYNPTVTINPVVGASVTWNYDNDNFTSYTTDANGEIIIPLSQRTNGIHAITISRYTESGIPTVLRFAPDFVYEISVEALTTTSADTTLTNTTTANTTTVVTTDTDNNTTIILFVTLGVVVVLAIVITVIVIQRKKTV